MTPQIKAGKDRVILTPKKEDSKRESVGPHSAKQLDSGLYIPVYDENEYDPDIVEQYAYVVAVPETAKERVDTHKWRTHEITIKPGDLCLVTHSLRKRHLRTGWPEKDSISIPYHHIYATVKDDVLKPNACHNIFEPIFLGKDEHTDKSGVVIPSTKTRSESFARAKWISQSLKDKGVKEGDIVGLAPNINYEVKFQGSPYFIVETDYVLCVVDPEFFGDALCELPTH